MSDKDANALHPLAVPFDQRSGEMMVYGGGFAALFVLSIALARLELAYFLAAFALAGLAFHFVPFVSKRRPALHASGDGLLISGVGLLSWDAIQRAEIINKSVRTIRNAELHLTLSRPLAAALRSPDDGGWVRRLMVQIARLEDQTLII